MTMHDWPPLDGLRAMPSAGATLAELASQLESSRLWAVLPSTNRATFDALTKAVSRAGLAWLAVSLVMARQPVDREWLARPNRPARDFITNDALGLVRAGLTELVRRGWYERAGERYRRIPSIHHSEVS